MPMTATELDAIAGDRLEAPLPDGGQPYATLLAPHDLAVALRAHVRQLIAERGLSQNAFAKELGRVQSSVSQLLTGQRHQRDLDVWQDIAAYFGRSLSELIAEAEHTPRTGEDSMRTVVGDDTALADLRRDVTLLKWMVGALLVLTSGGVVWLGFATMGRLP